LPCAMPLVRMEHSGDVGCRRSIIFVRHGESEYNKAIRESGRDPMLRDAPLTDRGRAQAAAARPKLSSSRAGVEAGIGGTPRWALLVSPLRRALDTAIGMWPEAFAGQAAEARVEVWPELREVVTGCDDLGTSASALRREYPQLGPQLAGLPEVWWTVPPSLRHLSGDGDDMRQAYRRDPDAFEEADEAAFEDRLDALVRRLSDSPERLLVVVAHCDLIGRLTRRLGLESESSDSSDSSGSQPGGWWLRNCECRAASDLDLQPGGKKRPLAPELDIKAQ